MSSSSPTGPAVRPSSSSSSSSRNVAVSAAAANLASPSSVTPSDIASSPRIRNAAEEDEAEEDGDDEGGKAMALPLAASIILTSLPRDASAALATAGDIGVEKVTIRLKPVGSAPILHRQVFKIGSKQRFSAVTASLRRRLAAQIQPGEGVFCYVNSVFAPNPDEVIGELWRCFKTGDELIVAYAKTPAFG